MACYSVHYQVSGSGAFPTDMLRYDRSYPARSDGAVAIASSPSDRRCAGAVAVELTHIGLVKAWAPTSWRWASFGWTVLSTYKPVRID